MALVLGLNVFTACYGAPMPPEGWTPEDETEVTEGTKAAGEEVAAVTDDASETAEKV